ncbi:hypothetical protein ciss_22020 [Carboxydothermus islandicus]|uniref:4Fe-4S ferredoxin-type domain-containing protein n=1 Tax=Carboxydothermus islandicus TaxID=661089 RepID=A0A1L8D509_9THEO|nr:aldo/keto reductase [Carboxydothermus islandicus]GAV26269.1 hypothetical protein ciss_22020 [Carboxydothermus islandicus]
MEYRVLGKSGLKVSRLGFGGIPIQRKNIREVRPVLDVLKEGGVNFIDSARAYTVSESFIGEAIKHDRKDWVVATKSMARTYSDMARDIDISLSELQTDYIDIYQLHNIKSEEEMNRVLAPGGALEALNDAKQAGKIRAIGVTTHNKDLLKKLLAAYDFETMMLPLNLVETDKEDAFIHAQKLGVGTIAMKPLAGGFFGENQEFPADVALYYLKNFSAVDVILVGMAEVNEARQNLEIFNLEVDLAAKVEALKEKASFATREFCRRCGYCQPCPVGIGIPTIFVLEAYYDRYGLPGWAIDRYRNLAVKADACQECGLCETRCPYGLPIRKKLKIVHQKLSLK